MLGVLQPVGDTVRKTDFSINTEGHRGVHFPLMALVIAFI